jgi:hypothetical protein
LSESQHDSIHSVAASAPLSNLRRWSLSWRNWLPEMIDLGTWLLITAMVYPLIGLALYSFSLMVVSSARIREITRDVPIWMMILAATLSWPSILIKASQKGSTRAALDRQGRDGRSQ